MSKETNPIIGTYQVCGTLGNAKPGAPIMHFNLLVTPSTHSVTGVVHITQAIAPPNGDISIQVTGKIFGAGITPVTQLVSLQGTYGQGYPPSMVIVQEHFTAHMAINNAWEGNGGFEYGNGVHHIENVPVKKGDCGK
ncbi:MAG: DUF1842 domain-containing protein [Flavipsychrobacter sp.]|nr:DUF1842 domain-containing protein [Flavipsychrobacter sp.]